ncbi:MAG: beta-ketoacyl synthase chain length factor [Candidatus Cryptobacteroides sp.]
MMDKEIYISSFFSIRPSTDGESDYREVIPNANMRRRMGRIVRLSVASALKCLAEVPGRIPDGVLTATALGCLEDSEKFASEIMAREESMLNPTSFIYSTFNTVGGQIALMEGLKTYNSTFVNGTASFSDALLDACLLVGEGRHNVLVLAFDEIIPTSKAVLERMGRFSPGSEGAVAFLISDIPSESCPCRISRFSPAAAPVSGERPLLSGSIESAFLLAREVGNLCSGTASREVSLPSSGTASREVSLPSLDIVIERI